MIGWPCAIVILGLTFMWFFRKEIGDLLYRVKSVNIPKVGSLTTIEDQLAEAHEGNPVGALPGPRAGNADSEGTDHPACYDIKEAFQNPMLSELARTLRQNLDNMNLASPTDREELLIKALAECQIVVLFEQIYRIIFGSQIEALHFLASTPGFSTEVDNIADYYKKSVRCGLDPEKVSFEMWRGYLESTVLVLQEGTRIGITVRGKEFLKYLIEQGLPPKSL